MHYTRCGLCPGLNACIPPDGPEGADILFVGEAPGKQEDAQALKHPPGRPFIGKTGEEVDRHYLPLAGIRRNAVRFTNAIRCLPVSSQGKLNAGRAKDIQLLDSCTRHHLYHDIDQSAPNVIVPLGAFACRAVIGEDFSLDLGHGLPTMTRWGIPAFPMFHPALGIHTPKKMLQIRTDWHRFKSYLKGTLKVAVDDYPNPDYAEVTDASELADLDANEPLALDTESKRGGEPYCLTYTQHPGTGRLIRANRRDLLLRFQRHLEEWRAPLLFHNWLYDWAVTTAMGLALPTGKIVDTMALVFHLGNLPQGLKALAFRELGMTMQDFDDVVRPYSTAKVMDYYMRASAVTWGKPDEELVMDDKTGQWKLYKPQSMNTKFKRFFTDYCKSEDKDVFSMWENNWESQQPTIEAVMGPWPGRCISHVPFDEALHYACRDADALIRLFPLLMAMRKRVRKFSQELWSPRTAA